MQATFPGKEIWIGEVGWPSAGRMREGALPSPVNQARFLSGVVAAAKQEGWKVNLIEAFDQPWKRLMEGTVGGYWGVYSDQRREPKFQFGESVSNHPDWRLKAGLGIGAAFLVFVAFWLGSRDAQTRERSWQPRRGGFGHRAWRGPRSSAWPSPTCRWKVKWRATGCARSPCWFWLSWFPSASAYALARGDRLAGFAEALDPSRWRRHDLVEIVLAALLAATVVAAMHVALGLVFDPRYKDFPFAALAGPVIALAVLGLATARAPIKPGAAEIAAAIVLTGSALFVIANEGIANWQALFSRGCSCCSRLPPCGRRPRQAEHEQRDRQRRGARVVKHEPHQREDQSRAEGHDVRPPQLHARGDHRHPAEAVLREHQDHCEAQFAESSSPRPPRKRPRSSSSE